MRHNEFAEADYVMINTPGMLRAMAAMMQEIGVRVEIEAFDTGHLWFAKQLVAEGLISSPVLVQLCMGVPWGADDLNTFMAMVNNVPDNWVFSAFSLWAASDAFVAASVLAGGNVRVGLGMVYLERSVLASTQLVEKAASIIQKMGVEVMSPQEVRQGCASKNAPARLAPTDQTWEKQMTDKQAAIIGGGVIEGMGSPFCPAVAGRLIQHDPDPDAERKVDKVLQNARASCRCLPTRLPKEGRLGQNVLSGRGGA